MQCHCRQWQESGAAVPIPSPCRPSWRVIAARQPPTALPRPPAWLRPPPTGGRVGGRGVVTHAVDPDLLTDPEVPVSKLQQLLEDAIDREDYSAAAQLRDAVQ